MEYGCIGEKLGHSFSKIVHNKLCDYNYELKEIPQSELDSFMKAADFKAINVTIPYKQAVIPYLYRISDTAKKIGAVNTIVNKNGKLYGYNTDFSGMVAMIENNNVSVNGKKVLILGSGGTSKTAVAVAQSLKAASVYRVSRSGSDCSITYSEAEKLHSDAEIIINTTPCGMFPDIGSAAVEIEKFPKAEAVIDAVYNPLNPALVVEAKQRGIKAFGGLYMLVAQAAFAAEWFTGNKIAVSEINRIYNEIIFSKQNIVLTGMPGCGKTTIGSAIATDFNKTFIDTDEEIIKTTGLKITEIFEKYGESGFRKIESEVIKKVSALQNCVISTGGGAVLNHNNISLLKENGVVVFIDRPIGDIVTTDDRPLSHNRELLEKRFAERYDIYKSTADYIVPAVGNLNDNIIAVKEVFINENSGDKRT